MKSPHTSLTSAKIFECHPFGFKVHTKILNKICITQTPFVPKSHAMLPSVCAPVTRALVYSLQINLHVLSYRLVFVHLSICGTHSLTHIHAFMDTGAYLL